MSAVAAFRTTKVGIAVSQLRQVSILCPKLRRGGGGRRDRYLFAHGATTMLALGLLLNTVGIGLFCWLIFTLTVYALPFFVAINAGIFAFHSGAGVFGTPLVAVAAGGTSLGTAQIAFAMTRTLVLRAIIAAVVALPAAFAGYHVVLAMTQIVARLAGALRLRRCGLHRRHSVDAIGRLHGARPVEPGRAVGDSPRRALAATTRG
jgi:hypothetical protein